MSSLRSYFFYSSFSFATIYCCLVKVFYATFFIIYYLIILSFGVIFIIYLLMSTIVSLVVLLYEESKMSENASLFIMPKWFPKSTSIDQK